jgi:hypothetical protein
MTLGTALTWSNGASVWLFKKSDGVQVLGTAGSLTAPYMGALDSVNTLSFTTQPVNTHINGTTTMASFTVNGNNADTANVTIALTAACGTTLGGTLTVALNGASPSQATFNAATLTGISTSACSLTASATGYANSASSSFWAGPNQITFTVQPNPAYLSGALVAATNTIQFGDGSTDTANSDSNTLTIGSCSTTIVAGSTTKNASSGVVTWLVTVSGAGTACKLTDSGSGLSIASNTFNVTFPVNANAGGTMLPRRRMIR